MEMEHCARAESKTAAALYGALAGMLAEAVVGDGEDFIFRS